MVEVTYNGSRAFLKNPDERLETFLAKHELRFSLKSIEMQNRKFGNRYNPIVNLYDTKSKSFPTGLLPRVVKTLRERDDLGQIDSIKGNVPKVHVEDIDIESIQLSEGKYLWDHQIGAIRTIMSSKRGTVQMPTGSGKTITMAMVAKLLPKEQILIISPSNEVTKNNKNTVEQITNEKVGLLNKDSKDVKRVTCATVQSAANLLEKGNSKLSDTSVLLVDECHTFGYNKSSRKISKGLCNTTYRVGFSGTAWREEGDQLAMEGYIGPKIYEITTKELQDRGILVNFDYVSLSISDDPNIEYPNYDREKGKYSTSDGKPERKDVYQQMVVENEERNEAIVRLAHEQHKQGYPYGPTLVMVESIEHSDIILDGLKSHLVEGKDVELVKGETPSSKRKEVIDRLFTQDLGICVATKVFNVGVDFPPAGLLIIGGGGGGSRKLIQKIGRVIRSSEGKSKALVIDFKDNERYYLFNNYRKRIESLKEQYPEVRVSEENDIQSLVKRFESKGQGPKKGNYGIPSNESLGI